MQRDIPEPAGSFNPSRRLIRVRQLRSDGFVEFDFAIGDAELYVELILPRAAFETFASQPGIERMSEDAAARAFQRQQSYLYGPAEAPLSHSNTYNNHQET